MTEHIDGSPADDKSRHRTALGKPSHIPLFRDAYLGDTFRLTLEQHGLYLMLMLEAWDQPDCTLPDDDAALAAICGITVARFRKISPAVLAKWTRDKGRVFQKRLLKEWQYVNEKRAKAKASAEVRWGCERNAKAMHLGGGVGEGVGNVPREELEIVRYPARDALKIVGGDK